MKWKRWKVVEHQYDGSTPLVVGEYFWYVAALNAVAWHEAFGEGESYEVVKL